MEFALTKFICTNQEAVIKDHGDTIWDIMCDELPGGKPWRIRDAVNVCTLAMPYARSTMHQYVRAVVHNVLSQDEGGIIPLGGQFYRFRGPSDDLPTMTEKHGEEYVTDLDENYAKLPPTNY